MTTNTKLEERFREFFSANALDGGDIDHEGTMIAPSLAVEVALLFLAQERAQVVKEMKKMVKEELQKHEGIAGTGRIACVRIYEALSRIGQEV